MQRNRILQKHKAVRSKTTRKNVTKMKPPLTNSKPGRRRILPPLPQKNKTKQKKEKQIPTLHVRTEETKIITISPPTLSEQIWLEEVSKSPQIIPWTIPPTSSTLAAVIVEPRKHPHLEYIVRNVCYFLGSEWSIYWFHGTENVDFARHLVQTSLKWVQLVQLPVSNLNGDTYSDLLASACFWNNISAENVLIFQTDVLLRRKGIERFLKYDYIGARWYFGGFGNGGLSFRKRSKMLELVTNNSKPWALNEDVYFMDLLKKDINAVLPTDEIAAEFSVETVFSPDPLGVHGIFRYLPADQVKQLLSAIRYG